MSEREDPATELRKIAPLGEPGDRHRIIAHGLEYGTAHYGEGELLTEANRLLGRRSGNHDGRAQVDGARDDVVAIRRALFEEPQATGDGAGPAREELAGTAGLCHRGQAALAFSDRGAGKTTVALILSLSAAVSGARVYYFDRENGQALTLARVEAILEANDWPDLLGEGRFVGRHYPQLSPRWAPESFGEAVAAEGIGLVIYDSLREAISQLGGDPNLDADISRFIDLAVTPLVRRGIAVLILDNTGHEAKDRPKGSGSKLDAIPQAYKVKTTERFSPAELGRVEITCARSRFGDMDRRWTLRVGAGTFELPQARDEAPDARAAREAHERREEFRRQCVAALRESAPRGRDVLIGEARKRGATGRTQRLREWLAELAADPASGLISTDEGYVPTPGPDRAGHGGATPPGDPPGPGPAPPIGGGPGAGAWPRDQGPGVPLATPEEEAKAARLVVADLEEDS